MRILIVPKFEKVDPPNSVTLVTMNLVVATVRQNPDCQYVIAVHEDFAYREWLDHLHLNDEEKSRITLLPVSAQLVGQPNFKKLGLVIGAALFNKIGPLNDETQFIDVCVASGVFASHAALRNGLGGTYSRGLSRQVPLVGWAEFNANDVWKSCLYNDWDGVAHLTGALWPDRIVWQSEYVKSEFMTGFKRWCTPAFVEKLNSKSEVIVPGVAVERIPMSEPWQRGQKFTAMWSGYYEDDYRYTVPALINAYKSGDIERLVVHFMPQFNPIPESDVAILKSLKNVEVYDYMSQDEYFKLLRGVHLLLGVVPMHCYSLRYTEIASAGVVPIVHPDVRMSMLPDDYPLVTSSQSIETLTMFIRGAVKFVKSDPSISLRVAEYVRKHHSRMVESQKFYKVVERVVDGARKSTKYSDFVTLAKKALEGVQSIGHYEAVEKIQELTSSKADLRKNAVVPPGFLRWAILESGFYDVGGKVPQYERV